MTSSMKRRVASIALILFSAVPHALWPPAVATVGAAPAVVASARVLPARLSDAAFWTLVSDISEPGGYFRIADNYTSNEREVGQVFTMLRESAVQGGVYLGVGPEQNFSYIASIRPAMAFVVDIRRQAVMQHLMFKAVFELSKDRADFISLLFSRARPAGITAETPIEEIWRAFALVPPDAASTSRNEARILSRLTETHKFALTAEELSTLKSVLAAFVGYGPSISTRGGSFGPNIGILSGGGFGGGSGGTFAELTGWSVDLNGRPQSFLSTDEHYQTVKALQDANLLVPVSGDFGGPKALRAIGKYLQAQGGTVRAFYVSNVEQYLFQDGKATAFYENVATLPLDDKSVFIRPYALRRSNTSLAALCPIAGFIKAASAGVYSNNDAVACGR